VRNGMGRLYDRFTPEERFRLVVEAISREDEQEVKRLAGGCPRKTYTMNELAYLDRVTASSKITTMVCLILAPRLAQLRTIRALREALPHLFDACIYEADLAYLEGHRAGSERAWRATGKMEDPPRWEGRREDESGDPAVEGDPRKRVSPLQQMVRGSIGRLEGLERDIVGEARTVWEAFARFCHDELGVEPEGLVKAWVGPLMPDLEQLTNVRMEDVSGGDGRGLVDPEAVEECAADLARVWRDMVRDI
jgi:hypothetical protein